MYVEGGRKKEVTCILIKLTCSEFLTENTTEKPISLAGLIQLVTNDDNILIFRLQQKSNSK